MMSPLLKTESLSVLLGNNEFVWPKARIEKRKNVDMNIFVMSVICLPRSVRPMRGNVLRLGVVADLHHKC